MTHMLTKLECSICNGHVDPFVREPVAQGYSVSACIYVFLVEYSQHLPKSSILDKTGRVGFSPSTSLRKTSNQLLARQDTTSCATDQNYNFINFVYYAETERAFGHGQQELPSWVALPSSCA